MFQYVRNVWRLRHFWLALVRIDLRSRYRRSMIGMGWSLLHPIAMTAVICTVFSQLFQADLRTYAPYLLNGLTFWNFICAVTNGGCQSIFQGESYIRQHPAPLAIYPLRVVLGAGIHFLLGMTIVLAFVWIVHGFGNLPALVSLVPSLVLILLFGWSLAICAGLINVLFQDTQHLVEVGLQILFYVTPILYTADLLKARHLEWLVAVNPLAAYLELLRQPILEGQLPAPAAMGMAVVTTLVAATIAILGLARMERRIIFYL